MKPFLKAETNSLLSADTETLDGLPLHRIVISTPREKRRELGKTLYISMRGKFIMHSPVMDVHVVKAVSCACVL